MIQPGVTFGSEGPLIQGTWVNPTTGDSFTVRDSFFEDNNYVITTTDGRYIRYDQFQNYVQADEKSVNEIKNNLKAKQQDEPLPAEISSLIANDDTDASMLIPEDATLIYGNKHDNKPVSLGNLNAVPQKIAKTSQPVEDMNTAIIKKALSSTETPKFKISLKWDNYPAKQIEMLYDIMGISEDEIVEWYLDNIQMIDIIDTIKDSIKNKITSSTKVEEAVEPKSSTIVEKPKTKATKTTKSKKS
jgi:hypothetical protein